MYKARSINCYYYTQLFDFAVGRSSVMSVYKMLSYRRETALQGAL